MDECFVCGVSGDKTRLFDAISSDGIVKVCERCSKDEHIPIIKKPTTFQLRREEKYPDGKSVYERMKKVSGFEEPAPRRVNLEKQEVSLRDIVDKNYKMKIEKESKPRPDLIDNFHWIIMRARRGKKLTQKQLAEAIAESEIAIKMAEKGILPEDDNKLINKLESFLGVCLVKKDFSQPEEGFVGEENAKISFDSVTTKNLTIADLKELRKKKEGEIFEKKDFNLEKVEDIDGVEDKKEDLGDKEMNDLIFGKK